MATAFHFTRRLILTGLAALVMSVLAIFPATAHDELIKAVPAENAELTTAPKEVALTFSGNLTTGQGIPNVVLVRGEDDTNWADGDAEVDGRTITVGLKKDLPAGEYRVSYRVVYSDGHPEEKMYRFTVTGDTESTATTPATSEPAASESATMASSPAASESAATGSDSAQESGQTSEESSGPGFGQWIAIGIGLALILGFFGWKRSTKRDPNA